MAENHAFNEFPPKYEIGRQINILQKEAVKIEEVSSLSNQFKFKDEEEDNINNHHGRFEKLVHGIGGVFHEMKNKFGDIKFTEKAKKAGSYLVDKSKVVANTVIDKGYEIKVE